MSPLSPDLSLAPLKELLRFYLENGVDCAVEEAGVDRFEETRDRMAAREMAARQAPSQQQGRPASAQYRDDGARAPAERPRRSEARPQPPVAPPPVAPAALPSEEAVMAAREAARSAASLEELREILAGFDGCNLKRTATQLVFADGNPEGRVMLVGEAPGRDEDLQGLPFVGRSGRLLDRMLAAIGLGRSGVYIANTIPWRPPGNRDPSPMERAICRPFIQQQIRLADPDFLILLGNAAAKEMLDTTMGITRLRGRWIDFDTGARQVRAMATFHPAYLLRNPLQKKLVWRDLLTLKAALEEPKD
ncbi:uracil-DNA glycosylase [Afifella sp. H1R]|uniref:uracil-DNA glycosylase n=1 Tax=Afifella sp. H1R TaxID=2908841 RepID=UPI001F1FA376|nr:uracil-DNA glycosylase [Afifella sp. H1R]